MIEEKKAIELIERLLLQMKLINGEKSNCVCRDPGVCPNHIVITDAERFLAALHDSAKEKK